MQCKQSSAHLNIDDTMSWASIVKRNASNAPITTIKATASTTATTTATATTPAIKPSTLTVPATFAQDIFTESFDRNRQTMAEFEKEEQSQCRPTYFGLKRPDAPSVYPIFRTTDEEWGWMRMEDAKNSAYSKEVFEERMQKWRIKHNWQLPPMKTTVSPDEMRKGFYIATNEETTEVRYITPYSTNPELSSDLSDELDEMMWCLVHSRSDELVACKTVAEFKALFERNIHLEPRLRHAHTYSRHRHKDTYPLKILWLFSQKANVFPGKARPGTARWTQDPIMKPSDYAFRRPPLFDPSVHTKSMVFFSLRACRDDATNEIRIGQHGGREETGLCIVERLKLDGDAAKIRWLLPAKQLREMERVVFWPECSPFHEAADDSDHYYSDDWL